MKVNKYLATVQDIESLQYEDFVIEGYKSHPAIKGEMAV
jgi:thymidylate synthase